MINGSALQKSVDWVATLAVIGVAAVVAWQTLRPGKPAAQQTSSYRVGELLRLPQGLHLGPAGALLIILRSSCPYCTASMEFYRRVVAAATPKVVVIGTESGDVLADYVGGHVFKPSQIISVGAGELRIVGTPTLILVGPDSRVKASWVGQLRPDQEAEVLRRVGS